MGKRSAVPAALVALGLVTACSSPAGRPDPATSSPTQSVTSAAPTPPRFGALPPVTRFRIRDLPRGPGPQIEFLAWDRDGAVVVEPNGRRTQLRLPKGLSNSPDGFVRLGDRWLVMLYYEGSRAGPVMLTYQHDGNRVASPDPCSFSFFTASSSSGRAVLCDVLYEGTALLRAGGAPTQFKGSNYAVGFLDHGDVVLNRSGDPYPAEEVVRIGHPDGTFTVARGLFAATASCEHKGWLAATTDPFASAAHGIYVARSGTLIRRAPDFRILRFSPSCRYVAATSTRRGIVLADTTTGTVLLRLKSPPYGSRETIYFEDETHLLLTSEDGGAPVIRVSVDGEAEFVSLPRTGLTLPPGP